MQIKKDTKVKVQYRPELGSGAVLHVAEAPGGEYNVDVIFEKDGKRFLETFPQSLLTPVADIFQRYQSNKSDHPTDFFLKQLAYQLPLENLKRFTEKAILRLGGAFIPSGDIIQITVPPAL